MREAGDRIALVTGANRGLGLEVARQMARLGYIVILGSRDEARGARAAASLLDEGLKVIPRQLDVTDGASVEALRAWIEAEFGRLDVLINNAGILYDDWQRPSTADLEIARQALETNALGAWRVAQAFIPLLRRGRHPRLVNVSSESGSLAMMGAQTPAYSMSKAAMNALTRTLAAELAPAGILVNSVCPGWVATDMGGPGGGPVEEGASGIVWAATLPDDGPTGGFFQNRKTLPW